MSNPSGILDIGGRAASACPLFTPKTRFLLDNVTLSDTKDRRERTLYQGGNSMSFLKKIANLFVDHTAGNDIAYWVFVRCGRCGEKIKSRIDMVHDLSANYGDREADTTYFTRKVLIGEQGCYQLIEVELTFDHHRRVIDRKIKGGEFITEEDYVENL
jgi:hypothetical protein